MLESWLTPLLSLIGLSSVTTLFLLVIIILLIINILRG